MFPGKTKMTPQMSQMMDGCIQMMKSPMQQPAGGSVMNHFTIFLFLAALVGSATASLAQTTSPYAGQEQRAIKALSDREISDLTEGRGMGLAKAAELNGYPGPMHVLELAESLDLSDQQRAKMQELFAAMKAEAIPLGERLIVQEADLD